MTRDNSSDSRSPRHTHVVINKKHNRYLSREEGSTTNQEKIYKVGERITPTKAELLAFPDRFEALNSASDD